MKRFAPFLVAGADAKTISTPGCRLLSALGISWGAADAAKPAGSLGLWLFRYSHLQRRTQEPDGRTLEHYRFASYQLELDVGPRRFGFTLAR